MLETVIAFIAVVVAVLAWQFPKRHPGMSASEIGDDSTAFTGPSSTLKRDANGGGEQKHTIAYVPDGIVFGDKVVLVPGLQQRLFTHSGWIESTIPRGQNYTWVDRGDVIGRYHMEIPNFDTDYLRHIMGSKHISAEIRSPVSGLVLHSYFDDFVSWPAPGDAENNLPLAAFSILIAEDEPLPEANSYMFARAVQLIRDCKRLLFRSSRRWSLGPMTEEQFSRLVKAQTDTECLVVDALPKFQDYLEEARTKYPSLRPHLKHLL
ncbi:unnamed protein product, partial [Ectocarpus sp. 12 AP-2014]